MRETPVASQKPARPRLTIPPKLSPENADFTGTQGPHRRRRPSEYFRHPERARGRGTSPCSTRRTGSSRSTSFEQHTGHRPHPDGHDDAGDGRPLGDAHDSRSSALLGSANHFVDGQSMVGDREKALEAGASDYVTKPVDPESLLAVMHAWMRKREPQPRHAP